MHRQQPGPPSLLPQQPDTPQPHPPFPKEGETEARVGRAAPSPRTFPSGTRLYPWKLRTSGAPGPPLSPGARQQGLRQAWEHSRTYSVATTATHTSVRKSRTWKRNGRGFSRPGVGCREARAAPPSEEGGRAPGSAHGGGGGGGRGTARSRSGERRVPGPRSLPAGGGGPRGSALPAGTGSCQAAPSPPTPAPLSGRAVRVRPRVRPPPVPAGSPTPSPSPSVPAGTHQRLHPRGGGAGGSPGGVPGGGEVSPRGWGLAPCTQERAQRRHRASGVQGTPQGGGLPAAPHPSTPMPGPTPPCRDPAPLRVSDLPTPRVPPPRAHRPAAGPRGCRRPRYRPHSPRREPPRRCRSPAPRAAAGSRIPAGRHRAGSGGAGRGRAERSGAERALPGPGPPPPAPAPPGTRPEPSTGTVPGTHPLRPATNRPGTEPSTHPACSGTEPGTPFSALSGFPPAWGCLQSPPPPRVPKPLPHL